MAWNKKAQSFDYDENSLLPNNSGVWHSRGYIPHFDAPSGVIQSITVHLGDALPATAVAEMQEELGLTKGWREKCVDPEKELELRRRETRLRWLCEKYLDAGYGSCVLADSHCADVVQKSLLWGDEHTYRLIAWCIMPTHFHVLLQPLGDTPLGNAMKSIKRHTTREIKKTIRVNVGHQSASVVDWGKAEALLTEGTRVWQRENWDRFIRNQGHFESALAYIQDNPVKAGLVKTPTDWPWSSAGQG